MLTVANAQPSGSIQFLEPYSVEELAVGTPVVPNSWQYKRYHCRPSEQYANSTWCSFSETKGGVTKVLTIMHLYNNIVTYVNKELSPGFFTNSEVDKKIARLSRQFNGSPRVYRAPNRPGLPGGIIATWGGVELQPLGPSDLAILAQGKSPHRGVLVDYLVDFQESARAGLPIYSLNGGGAGYVWIARFDKKGKGKLRFFAADPSQMQRLQPDNLPEANASPLLHALPVPASGCSEYTVTVHDYGQVRGKPSLSGRPLWRLVPGSNVTICSKDIATDERNIPWIWVQFKSQEEPWDHKGYISFRLLQGINPQPILPSPPEKNSPPITIPMENVGGVYQVPIRLNDTITLDAIVDSGASDVSVPADVVLTLIRSKTIAPEDFIGAETYEFADGSKAPSQRFMIKSLKVGNKTLENVIASIGSVRGQILLGQSFLSRFGSWTIDNKKHALILN
jgi:predicted aspartyl protease